MHLNKFFESNTGKYLLSIILGLGLASLFRSVCKGKNCLIYKAPPLEEINNKIYKHDDKCYKFNPVSVKCNTEKTIVSM
jgi:hypothetical protein